MFLNGNYYIVKGYKYCREIALSRDYDEGETIEEEIIRQLMDLRGYLETRMRELDEESEKVKALYKIVDEVIVTKSFKKAETIPTASTEKPSTPAFKEEIPLKTSMGMLLATIYIGDDEARIVPAEGIVFTMSTPPFQQFLISRILEPMQVKDKEESEKGLIMPSQTLSYETVTEGEVIKKLIIRNYGTRNRLREIVSSSRWTFDKMYEKSRTSGSET